MDPLAEARALLPGWVVWGGTVAYLALAALVSLGASALAVHLALGFGRSDGDAHWTEKARRSFPARVTSGLCLVALPVTFGMLAYLWTGPLSLFSSFQLGLGAAASSALAVLVVHFRLTRRVLPVPPSFGSWLVGSGVMWLAVRPLLPLAVLLALVAPLELLSPSMGLWLALALTLFWLALRGHLLRALVVVGGARHASPELCAIVERAARRQEEKPARPLPRVLVLRWPVVNALAYPSGNILAFTDAAVALLDDDELGAVAAHELGHLAEPTRAQLVRSLQALMWIPLAALRPLHHAFGLPALFGMLAVFALTVGPLRRFSRRMERHADRHAHEDGQDEGLYARTLEKLYRLNAIPAVLPRAQATHPHLYDRLRAAGVEPDYPRPAPPPRWRSLAGMTVAMVLAVLPTVAAWWAPSWLDPAGEDEEQMALASLALGPGGSWELGTLADLRLEEGDSAAAVVLYRAAATLAHQPGLELARLTGALVAAGRCGEAEETYRALDDGRLLVPPEELAAAEASVASCRGAR